MFCYNSAYLTVKQDPHLLIHDFCYVILSQLSMIAPPVSIKSSHFTANFYHRRYDFCYFYYSLCLSFLSIYMLNLSPKIMTQRILFKNKIANLLLQIYFDFCPFKVQRLIMLIFFRLCFHDYFSYKVIIFHLAQCN